jgi:hypothetical protein
MNLLLFPFLCRSTCLLLGYVLYVTLCISVTTLFWRCARYLRISRSCGEGNVNVTSFCNVTTHGVIPSTVPFRPEITMKRELRNLAPILCANISLTNTMSPILTHKGWMSIGYIIINFTCFIWSLGEKKQHKLVFQDKVLTGIFEPKRGEVRRGQRTLLMRNFIICTLHQILEGWSNEGGRV